MRYRTFVLITLFVVENYAKTSGQEETAPYSKQLIRHLIESLDYDPRIRPVQNYSHPINVTIRMNLYQIVDVNERNQHVALYMWVEQKWRDEFLKWKPEQYGDMDSIVIPYDRVWLPDTYLYNSLEMVRENTERWISIVLYMAPNDTTAATVAFRYPAIYRYTCNMDILYFPFDKQKCTMFFGSWMYDAAGIDYHPLTEKVILSDFIPSEEWDVISFMCKRVEFRYKCCPVPFAVLVCDLIIQRKPLHYLVNLVVPTLIITLISFVGFFSPASTNGERTEKVNLGITTLLAMSILLLMVSDQMPTTSNFVPLIGWFYLSVILLISVATIMTAVIIMIEKKGYYGHRVPKVVKIIFFRYLATCVRMKTPVDLLSTLNKTKKSDAAYSHQNSKEYETDHRIPLTCTVETVASDGATDDDRVPPDSTNFNSSSRESERFRLLSPSIEGGGKKSPSLESNHCRPLVDDGIVGQLGRIQRQLVQINEYIKFKDETKLLRLEWEWVAAILDRVLLILFTCIALGVTVIICFVGMFVHQSVD